jgi:K+-transporting ATPase KdpF subunit
VTISKGSPVGIEYAIGLLIAGAVAAYLVYALIRPERF